MFLGMYQEDIFLSCRFGSDKLVIVFLQIRPGQIQPAFGCGRVGCIHLFVPVMIDNVHILLLYGTQFLSLCPE
jgi:hypothetical protein